MTILLDANEVEHLASMPRLVEAVERGVLEEANSTVVLPARMNLNMRDGGFFRVMPALIHGRGVMGYKVFHGSIETGVRYLIVIYSQESGELLAIMDAHYLTAARTGATTGVATKYMARKDTPHVAVIGSGLEARTNLLGVMAVRTVKRVTVYSPNPQRRKAFARRMAEELGIEIIPMDSPEAAVRDADIVVVGTNTTGRAATIAYQGAWSQAGMHINSIGSTMLRLREIDPDTFGNAGRIVVDSLHQVREESGDVVAAIKENKFPAERVFELKDIVGGKVAGRGEDREITLFKSVGTAIQDVMAGFAVYEEAVRQGRGRDVGELLSVKQFGS
ncbi:MAG: ornithine cyclodeaminase family protein [Candidatus Binataceae bacterium]|nr:ornithine cyclodeaminase family protein [Candidatus Binataceae bacterium]